MALVLVPNPFRQRLTQWAATKNPPPTFSGASLDAAELRRWFQIIEAACKVFDVPRKNWTDVGIMFLLGDLKNVMQARRDAYLEREPNQSFWRWEDFKVDIRGLLAEAARVRAEALRRNPGGGLNSLLAVSAGVGLAMTGGAVLLPALGVLTLNAVGFAATGVVGGSVAAAAQSLFYGGATGGLFSVLQSVGATAVLPSVGSAIASTFAAGAGAAVLTSEMSGEGASSPGPPEPGPSTRTRVRLVQWAATTSHFPWFTGVSSTSELRRWFTTIESAYDDNEVEEKDMAEAAIMFITGDLKHVMEERRITFIETEQDQTFWRWDDFKDELAGIVEEAERIKAEGDKDPLLKIVRFRRDHPHIAATMGVGLAVFGSIILIPGLVLLALISIGFSAGGVVSGCLAPVF